MLLEIYGKLLECVLIVHFGPLCTMKIEKMFKVSLNFVLTTVLIPIWEMRASLSHRPLTYKSIHRRVKAAKLARMDIMSCACWSLFQ